MTANGWSTVLAYGIVWLWVCSPWVRFAVLPGLTPHRGIPLWVWPWE